MPPGAVQTDETPIPLEERQALVDRIAGSNELRRSARLRAFLLYVWSRVAADQAVVIHEQEIGSAVFGRPEYYDTSVDNIVRVNATELRKRLERYFAEEGAGEELILEIQRGSYVPCFRRRTVAPPPPDPAAAPADPAAAQLVTPDPPAIEAPPEPAPVAVSTAARFAWVWKAACLVLLLCCGGLFWWAQTLRDQLEPWRADPAMEMFWSQFFESGTPTDVVLADTSLAVAEDIMQRSISLTDYLNYNYKRMGDSLPPNDPAVRPCSRC